MEHEPTIQKATSKELPSPVQHRGIRTEDGFFHGRLVGSGGSIRLIEVSTLNGQNVENTEIEIDTSTLRPGETFSFKFSTDNGKSWKTTESNSPLSGALVWESSDKVTSISDLVAGSEQESGLPENTETNESKYAEALEPYQHISNAIKYSNENPDDAKCNFAFGDTNTGWKSHLNVTPENVQVVSNFLRENNFAHKYLTGGNGTEGKAFTVYFGARSMMDKWASYISDNLSTNLSAPAAEDESTVAPGVVSRFTAMDKISSGDAFAQYGKHGMCARKEFILDLAKQRGGMDKIHSVEDSLVIAQDSYDSLTERYGSYFHG